MIFFAYFQSKIKYLIQSEIKLIEIGFNDDIVNL